MLLGAQIEGLDLSALAEEHRSGDSVQDILRGYRERFDGAGPNGWSREQQRLPVRIASLVVAFEEATMGRRNGHEISLEAAGDLRRCAFHSPSYGSRAGGALLVAALLFSPLWVSVLCDLWSGAPPALRWFGVLGSMFCRPLQGLLQVLIRGGTIAGCTVGRASVI